MTAILKPHIQRAHPRDGDGWICYRSEDEEIGFGATPADAFWNWVCDKSFRALVQRRKRDKSQEVIISDPHEGPL